jgi:hypothetical protein
MSRPTLHVRGSRSRGGSAVIPTAEITAAASFPSQVSDAGVPTLETEPDGMAVIHSGERQAMIAQAAYFRAERRGFEPGHEMEDWLAAELDVQQSLLHAPGAGTG